MKYMISWNERPQGSPIEYETAQKRILEVFSPWKAPANFKIESFVIRVGETELALGPEVACQIFVKRIPQVSPEEVAAD